jgi:uncharacterized protein YbjT (DUF2867 family)
MLLASITKMKVLIFGATGMVGQGVLRECLLASDVDLVVTIGRNATGQQNQKLREIVHPDLFDYSSIENQLSGFDACFFCLGVTSFGMKEPDYTRITYTLTVAAAETLARLNPHMTFIYVSGVGTDSSERGRSMWARVKGRTENSLLRLPFRAAYMFRPGFIEAVHGIRSRTTLYRIFYLIGRPVFPLIRRAFPNQVLTTEDIGRAMLNAERRGYSKRVLEPPDIRALVAG